MMTDFFSLNHITLISEKGPAPTNELLLIAINDI